MERFIRSAFFPANSSTQKIVKIGLKKKVEVGTTKAFSKSTTTRPL